MIMSLLLISVCIVVTYSRVGKVSVGVRHAIKNKTVVVDDGGVVIFGTLVCRLSISVTVDNDKLLI